MRARPPVLLPATTPGARNKLERALGASSHLDYDGGATRSSAGDHGGVPHFHLLLHSLFEAGLFKNDPKGRSRRRPTRCAPCVRLGRTRTLER